MAKLPPPLAGYPRSELADIGAQRTYMTKVMGPLSQMHLTKTGKGGSIRRTKTPTAAQIVNAGHVVS